MKISKILLLSTVAMIGSFTTIETKVSLKKETAAEKLTKIVHTAICHCENDENGSKYRNDIENLIPQLTTNQLATIVNGPLFKDIIEKNKKIDCDNCKDIEDIFFKEAQNFCKKEIEEGNGNLTIFQLMELKREKRLKKLELELSPNITIELTQD